ncbi:hypothetical protein KXW58_006112 [Aspergillus fumigatus]|nr:hypothetical protein KXW58_006112 [Aspergillus fumigatus]
MSGEHLPFHHAERYYKQRVWKTGEGADVSIIIGGFSIPVYSSVLEEESRYFQSQFRRSFQKRGRLELHFEIKNVNTVWRTLELIYLGTYSNELCPLSSLSDEGNELALHGSVYNLAVCWGLSNNLQEIIFRNYKNTIENSWQPLAFLESVNIIFGLPGESTIVHAPEMSIIDGDWLDPNRLREDRIAQLVVQQLETRREAFEGDSSIMLIQSLQNYPVLLRIFLQRWLVAKRKS